MRIPTLFALGFSQSLVFAQNFQVPATWREPTSTRSRSEREALIPPVVDDVVSFINTSTNVDSNLPPTLLSSLMSGIALVDFLTVNTTHLAFVTSGLDAIKPLFVSPNDSGWGLAAINAHRAYQDSDSLNLAERTWNLTSQYQIQPDDAAKGSLPSKNISFSSKCNGDSVVGGVFETIDPEDTLVDAVVMGEYLGLSALLYEATGNSKYVTSAEMAAQFLQAHLYNGTVILDSIDLKDCTTGNSPSSFESGLAIEGLSVLATSNGTFTSFLEDLISTSVPFVGWTALNGINVEGASSGNVAGANFDASLKSIFIRGLFEAWSRMDPTTSAATFIQSYILVQFNALLDLASTSGSNQYSPAWQGPPVPTNQSLLGGQQSALNVLNSAFGLSQTSHESRSRSKIAIIVGASVGGVAFIVLSVLAIWFWRRRRQRQLRESHVRLLLEETAVPYVERPDPASFHNLPGRKGDIAELHTNTHDAVPAQLVSSVDTHEPRDAALGDGDTDDADAVPQLLQRLNRAIARLPPGGIDAEDPPEYQT